MYVILLVFSMDLIPWLQEISSDGEKILLQYLVIAEWISQNFKDEKLTNIVLLFQQLHILLHTGSHWHITEQDIYFILHTRKVWQTESDFSSSSKDANLTET